MPKKNNSIERDAEDIHQTAEPLADPVCRGQSPPTTPDRKRNCVERIEPVKKKREMSEEQRQKQAENLKRGREALQQKRQAKLQEEAKMVVEAVKPKKDKVEELVKTIQAVQQHEEEEEEPQVVVVKKKRAPKKIIMVQEESEDEEPLPPPVAAPKPKRVYKKREPKQAEDKPVATTPKPSIIFY